MQDDEITNPMEREQFLNASTAWLLEMEYLDSPQLKNAIYLNILNSSRRVTNAELLVDKNSKGMLIYLELTWIGRIFGYKKEIAENIIVMLSEVLPSFRFRVIYSKAIWELAVQKAKEIAEGKYWVGEDGRYRRVLDENTDKSRNATDRQSRPGKSAKGD